MSDGHRGVFHFGTDVGTGQGSASEPQAWESFVCGECGESVNGAVLARSNDGQVWLRCMSCGTACVRDRDGGLHPGEKYGPQVAGLPTDVDAAYNEARRCMSVAAFTAAELMCRKILMHVSADKGAGEGRPFVEYVNHLETQGYITPPMKPWVDRIRQHGNEATHELPATSRERAEDTLQFTAQLLRIIYEMEHLGTKYAAPPTPASP